MMKVLVACEYSGVVRRAFNKLNNVVEGRDQRIHMMPPGPDRWKKRSRTYEGIAAAMAQQWGTLSDEDNSPEIREREYA